VEVPGGDRPEPITPRAPRLPGQGSRHKAPALEPWPADRWRGEALKALVQSLEVLERPVQLDLELELQLELILELQLELTLELELELILELTLELELILGLTLELILKLTLELELALLLLVLEVDEIVGDRGGRRRPGRHGFPIPADLPLALAGRGQHHGARHQHHRVGDLN
jgi:hypothetical protein